MPSRSTKAGGAQPTEVILRRGAIRPCVRTSTDGLIAGRPFTVHVTVHNPYEVPIRLKNVRVVPPVEFIDMHDVRRQRRLRMLQELYGELSAGRRWLRLRRLKSCLNRGASWVWRGLAELLAGAAPGERAAMRAIIAWEKSTEEDADFPLSRRYLRMRYDRVPLVVTKAIREETRANADPGRARPNRSAPKRKDAQMDMSELKKAIGRLEEPPTPKEVVLQPGNSSTRAVTVRAKQPVWFRPSAYAFKVEVQYTLSRKPHYDAMEHQIQVLAPLWMVVLGALIGSVVGRLARCSGWPDRLDLFSAFGLAVMAVVVLARKKGSEPIVSIHDFWGGMAIGAIAAYLGPEWLRSTIGQNLPDVPGS